ncbi:MAG: HAD family phosphatase [Thermoleophilia bacterium]|nr:HAD family phosphatase [Thermoleophilia bacterium]
MDVAAVIFDMDGTLAETEHVWDRVREDLARERGGAWSDRAHTDMMGMSSPEWTGYMHRELGVPMTPDEIRDEVVARLIATYRADPPFLPGAVDAVRRMAREYPCGIASSSNREIIAFMIDLGGMAQEITAFGASEEVARGKPHPGIYIEVAARLGADAARCVAVEDSTAGLRSALDAGMRVVAVPNPDYPPDPAVVARCHLIVDRIAGLTPDLLRTSLSP